MTEEIIIFNKSDVESLEEAIKCLEQELKANKKLSEDLWQHGISMREWREQSIKYRSALEEIREILNKDCDYLGNVVNAKEFIDEVLTP